MGRINTAFILVFISNPFDGIFKTSVGCQTRRDGSNRGGRQEIPLVELAISIIKHYICC